MSYQICLGLLEDISRITKQKQDFVLSIQSYNHSVSQTTSVPLSHPSWDYNQCFLGSQKQIIVFRLCSLHIDHYMKVLATGKLDIRQYINRNQAQRNFSLKLSLYSSYNNDVLLHIKCSYTNQNWSRNDGLKWIKRSSNLNLKNQNQKIANDEPKSRIFGSRNMENRTDNVTFFKGACETRNFFSFLDPVYKGQSYYFIEPVKK